MSSNDKKEKKKKSKSKSESKSKSSKSKPAIKMKNTSIGLTASKLVALVGALQVITDSLGLFSAGWLGILGGILGIIFAVFIFVSLNIVEIKKINLPYEWWLLLIFGIVLIVLSMFVSGSFLGGVILIIAAILDLLAGKKSIGASRLVVLIGAGWTIYDAVMLFMTGDVVNIILAIIGIALGVILFIASDVVVKNKIPFEWWLVLLIGFVLYALISAFIMSGTIILIGFLLMLVAE